MKNEEMRTVMPSHNYTVSIAKALCIILMVIGHSGCPEHLHQFIYLFHMPCFFFLSGYLFKDKYLTEKIGCIKKRIKGLWWPFVKWSVIFMLLHNLSYKWYLYPSSYTLPEMGVKFLRILVLAGSEQLLGGFWFLKELFYASIISLFVLSGWKRINNVIICKWGVILPGIFLLLAFILSIIPYKIPVIGSVTLLASAYYLTGYFFRNTNIVMGKSLLSFLGLGLLSFSISLFFKGSMQIKGWELLPYFFVSLIGTFAVINLSRFLQNWKVGKALNSIGSKTLYILVFHFISFKLVSLWKVWQYDLPISALSDFPVIKEYNTLYWVVYSLVGVLLPLLLLTFTDRVAIAYKKRKNRLQKWVTLTGSRYQ